ncbi:hypothetical protein V2605_03500 [Tenacibaculum maritimum]|uniref:hypothetical protein n=1 Tax=Tenacibaculum maritimum TaxID=107401 RepID=UPI0012E6EF8C|nr:hypothetical protein [Tenacibaculum maritimum]CAA0254554.1 putative Chromosome segregation ATPase-like protein [Tenacibaculum maritimum]
MAEKIKLLEADIDFEKLLKKGADAKKSIEFLKTEVKFFQNSIKEGKGIIASYQESLSKMEKQGKKNSKEYKTQEKNLNSLLNSQESNRQKLELVETNLRKQQKSYRLTKKGIDSYNKTLLDEINIIDKTDGSITQLEHALAENRKAYRGLTKEQRESVDIGGKLFKVISQQDQEYKELQKSIGTTQVDVGNYKGQIKELLGENVNLSKTFKGQIEQIPIVGQLLGGVYGILLKYAKAQRVAIATTKGSTKAFKIFNLLLASSLIGLIVVALGSLIAYLSSTQQGINKVNKILIPLKTIFSSLIGLFQKVGEAMFNAFANPQESIKALWKSIKTNLINRVTAIGGIFKALGKIISSGFTDGYKDLANSSLQAVTGVEDVIGKTKKFADETNKFFSEAYKRGERIAEIQRLLSAGEADFITKVAEGKEAFKDQNKIAEDQTKTLAEREAAVQKSIEILKETNNEQRKRNALELELLQLKAASNDTSDEDRAEIARKVAELKEANAQLLEAETTQQNKLNTIRKEANNKAIAAAKKRIDADIKSSQVALNRYILENDKINSTLDERVKFYQSALQKESNILKQQLDANKITQEEYELALLEKKTEYTERINEATISNLEKELDLYIANNQSKIEDETLLTEQLISEEENRLTEIYNRRLAILEEQRENELISDQDFLLQKLEIQGQYLEQKKELEDSFDEQKKEQLLLEKEKEQLDYENELEIRRLRGESEFQLRYEELERKRQLEIEQAKKKGVDVEKVEKKYAERKKLLDKQVQEAKLNAFQSVFGQIKGLFGEETAVGKAAAIAETTINTYKAATAAYSAMAGIPIVGPALGAVAAGLAVAAGIANVRKITSTKTTYQDGGLLQGNSHAQGGIPFTIGGQPGFEAEGGEFIVNKVSTAKYRPLLEHINKQNGIGVSNPSRLYQNGGIVTRNIQQTQNTQNQSIDYETMAQKIGERVGEANRQLPNPVVTVEDINTGQSNVAEVVNGANI